MAEDNAVNAEKNNAENNASNQDVAAVSMGAAIPRKVDLVQAFGPSHFATFSLELQYSVDFFQRQLKQTSPEKLLLDSVFNSCAGLNQYLKEQYENMDIEMLDLNKQLKGEFSIDDNYQTDYLAVIGAGMMSMSIALEDGDEAKN